VQYWPLLLDLLERQNRRCTYSGIPIELGKTASLDHIVAKSKGGKNTIENLQWVHIWINKMKNTMSNDEFVTALDEFSSQLAAYRTSKN
jgi:5-methylcytosine-specific restriction endonuclease McrA